MSKIASTICLTISILLLTSCALLNLAREEWLMPSKPETSPINFTHISTVSDRQSGFYISPEDAKDLAGNVEELKAYSKKLEILIEEMKDYYKAK